MIILILIPLAFKRNAIIEITIKIAKVINKSIFYIKKSYKKIKKFIIKNSKFFKIFKV